MRKGIIISFAAMLMSMSAMAQNVWEKPVVEDNSKSESEKSKVVVTDSKGKTKVLKIEEKYAEGAVPEVDGKVEWKHVIPATGDVKQTYERVLKAVTALTKDEMQTERSQVAAVNSADHIIAAQLVENMDFKKNAISHDFAEFKYTLICYCFADRVELTLCRISYIYNVMRSDQVTYAAENWITDAQAMNKSRTNLYPSNGKFRKKTIDRKDEIFAYFDNELK